MKNYTVKTAAMKANVRLWQIADRLGITDSSFSRKLRRELPDEEQRRILAIIEEIRTSREAKP